eukprot:6604927-Ditylum_brightwellii.AAC.1
MWLYEEDESCKPAGDFLRYLQKEYGPMWFSRLSKTWKWKKVDELQYALHSELENDVRAGRNIISCACNSSWWEWTDGST